MRNIFLALAFGLALAPSAAAQGWPMQHGNAQHTSSTSLAGFEKIRLAWTKDLGVIPNPATKDAPQSGQGVSVAPDGNLIVSASTAVYKISSATGDLLWTYAPGSAARFTQALVDANRVYVASSGLITALNQATGAMVWQLPVDAANPVASTRMSDGAAGFVTRFSSPSAAIALIPGSSWFLITGNDSMDDEAASGFNHGLLSVSTGGFVHTAKHLATDSVSQAAIARDGSVILAKSRDTGASSMQIYAFDSQFNLLWSTSSLSGRGEWGMALGTGTLANPTAVFFPVFKTQYRLGAYNMATGAHIWTSTFTMAFSGFEPGHSAIPVYDEANNRVYMNDTTHLHAFDAATGLGLWSSPRLAENTVSSPNWSVGTPLVAGSTTVFITAIQAASGSIKPLRLWNIDSSNGAARWSVAIGSIPANPYALYTSLQTPQIVPGTNAFFAYTPRRNSPSDGTSNHHYLSRYEPAAYDAVTVSTGATFDTGAGVIRSTGSIRVTQGGSPVSGVPVTVTTVDEVCAAGMSILDSNQQYFVSASSLTYHTDSSGYVQFFHEYTGASMPSSCFQDHYTTATLSVPSMPDAQIFFKESRVSSYTITVSTPSIEFISGILLQVTTVTVNVKNSANAALAGIPVLTEIANYTDDCNATNPEAAITPADGFRMTDGSGNAVFTHRLRYAEGSIACKPGRDLPNVDPRVNVYVRGAAPTLNRSIVGVSPSTYTVSFSSSLLTTDVGHATMTVTVFDAAGSTIPSAVVYLKNLVSGSNFVYSFGGYAPAATCTGDNIIGYTDALGKAEFLLDTRLCTGFDNFNTFLTTVPVFTPGIAVTSPTLAVDSNFLGGYVVSVPTITSVGVAFRSTITAVNYAGRALPRYNESGVTLTPLFDQTEVQGTGTLGTSVVSFAASAGEVVLSSQTYNKIEDIQIKATRGSGSIKTGTSGTLFVRGPDRFVITIPTGTAAGQVFTGTITAVDAGGNPVVGYGATLSLTPVLAASTATAGTGSLTPATVNLPANGKVVVNNLSYSKGEGIRIRVFDSSLNIDGYSSSITVTAPALTISHYSITAPTQVTVGLPFSFQVNALDASSAPVTYNLSRAITVQTFLNGTAISGSGSLGVAAMTLQAGSTYTYTASQTYNKIETIQIKVTDEDGRNATSGPILFSGPTQFDVTMPTAALAGSPFQIVVVARDAGNNQVLGYNGTVNIAAVQASNTALSGAGTLGVTSLNIASGLGTSAFQTYTKAEGMRLRVSDSAIGVTSYSSSATVRAGTPASITLLANPQSTIAGVPSVLTATIYDAYTNAVTNSTATFSVATGSGVVSLSLSNGSVVSAVTSTQAVTDAFGQATAFFSSTNSLSAQANLLRASIGSLARDTTVYSTVLVTSAGGAVVNFSNPLLRADIPANTYGFSVRLGIQGRDELPAADLALTTAAFAATANTFVSTTVLKLSAVRDASPTTPAGAGSRLVTVSMPYSVTSGSISVGAYGAQSILVPLSVMRIFKLNQTSSVFEQVIDGVTAINSITGVVTAEVSDPDGIYALGAPAFTNLTTGSSATVTTALAGGTTAEVVVPQGGFSEPATISVTVPSASAVPALPARPGLTALGVTISVTAGGLQPASPVTIKIGYTPAAVAGVNPDHLRLARYDATTGWVVLESAADTATRQVVGTTDHFSLFQIVAQAPGSSVAEGFVYPNPFRPSRGHTNIKLSSLPAGASVKIFTATGRLLKELAADAAGQVLGWNGTDRDGRPLASGVYLAVVEGAGGRRTIKFAVQR